MQTFVMSGLNLRNAKSKEETVLILIFKKGIYIRVLYRLFLFVKVLLLPHFLIVVDQPSCGAVMTLDILRLVKLS